MAKVRCYECKKSYDYSEDAFCPHCGGFNQPPRASRIDATGSIVYHDGINLLYFSCLEALFVSF